MAAATTVPFSPIKAAASLSKKLLEFVRDNICSNVSATTAPIIFELNDVVGPFSFVMQNLHEIVAGQKHLKAVQEAMMISSQWSGPKLFDIDVEKNLILLANRLRVSKRQMGNAEEKEKQLNLLRCDIENTVLNHLRTIHSMVVGAPLIVESGMRPQESTLELWCQHCSKLLDEDPNMSWLVYRDYQQSYLASVLYLQLLGVILLIFHYTTRAEPSAGDLCMIQECYDRMNGQIDLYRALVPESVDFLADVLGAGKTAYLKVARPVGAPASPQDTYLRVGYGPNNTDIRDNRRSRTEGPHLYHSNRATLYMYNPLYTDTEPYAWAITLVSGRSFRLEPVEHPGKPLTRFAIAEQTGFPYRIHAGALMDPATTFPREEINLEEGPYANSATNNIIKQLNDAFQAHSSDALFKFVPYSTKKEKFDKGEVSYQDGNLIAADLYPEERGRVRLMDEDWNFLALDSQHPFKNDGKYYGGLDNLFDIVLVEDVEK